MSQGSVFTTAARPHGDAEPDRDEGQAEHAAELFDIHLAQMGQVPDATVGRVLGDNLASEVVAVDAAGAAEDDARAALTGGFEQHSCADQIGALGAQRLALGQRRARLGSQVVDARRTLGEGAGAIERLLDGGRIGHVALDQGEAVRARHGAARRAGEVVQADHRFAAEQEATRHLGAYVPYAGQQRDHRRDDTCGALTFWACASTTSRTARRWRGFGTR